MAPSLRPGLTAVAERRGLWTTAWVLLLVLIGAMAFGSTSATASQVCGTVAVNPTAGTAGTAVQVSGSGSFATPVTITLDGVSLGQVTLGRGATTFATTVTIPADSSAGTKTLTASSASCNASTPFVVQTPAPATTTTQANNPPTTTTTTQPSTTCDDLTVNVYIAGSDEPVFENFVVVEVSGVPPNGDYTLSLNGEPWSPFGESVFTAEADGTDRFAAALANTFISDLGSLPSVPDLPYATVEIVATAVDTGCSSAYLFDLNAGCDNPSLYVYVAGAEEPVFEDFLVVEVSGFPPHGTYLLVMNDLSWHHLGGYVRTLDASGHDKFAAALATTFFEQNPTMIGLTPGTYPISAGNGLGCGASYLFDSNPPETTSGPATPPGSDVTLAPSPDLTIPPAGSNESDGAPIGWLAAIVGVAVIAGWGGWVFGRKAS